MALDRKDIKALVKRIEEILNAEISLGPRPRLAAQASQPPNPAGGSRTMYVPLPGTGSRFKLSPRAQQVYSFLTRNRKASPGALQAGLKVNRNVIAGAVHELKRKHAIRVERSASTRQPVATAAEYAPARRSKPRKRTRR